MKLRFVIVSVFALIATACAGSFVWHSVDRTGFIATVCRAGLPNLSRPSEISADTLGCNVLGARQVVSGSVFTDFEAAYFLPDNTDAAAKGAVHGSAWFSGTDGLMQRGGDTLKRVLEVRRPGLCGGRLAMVEVEGWMTTSPGGYGHLNIAGREFYAYRVIAARPPTETELQPFRKDDASDAPLGFGEFCRQREREDYKGL